MTTDAAMDLIRRMHYYEQHPHFDGYDVTLGDYRNAVASYPVTMSLALHWYPNGIGMTDEVTLPEVPQTCP